MRSLNTPVKKLDITDLEKISGGNSSISPKLLYVDAEPVKAVSIRADQNVSFGKACDDFFGKVKDFFVNLPKFSTENTVMPVIISHITSLHC